MLRVMRNHRRAAYGAAVGYEGVSTAPVPLDDESCTDKDLVTHARQAWDKPSISVKPMATAMPSQR